MASPFTEGCSRRNKADTATQLYFMKNTTETHKQFANKVVWPALKEIGLTGSTGFEEATMNEMPKREPDFYLTLGSGVKVPVWEEPTNPKVNQGAQLLTP